MGNWWSATKEPPPLVVLVPPLFDFPPLAARTRMLESSYNLLFGKLALRCLFEDYFEEARHFSTRIMLRPIDDPHVDLIASVAGPLDYKPKDHHNIVGNAQFRWQSDVEKPHTFVDLYVSNSEPILLMISCAYCTQYGIGAFGIFPVLLKKRVSPEDYGVMGLRYGSSNLSCGATISPFPSAEEIPKTAWLVSQIGRLTAGLQYEPQFESKDVPKYKNLKNWSCAIGYGVGSGSPLSPSFNFGLELSRNSQFIASFYQHVVVQRRVKNPLEENEVVGITNYIDFGFELQSRVDDEKASSSTQDSTFQVAASWQANKNLLLKGKVGPLSSSMALAFKSWWKPSFTVSLSAIRDRTKGQTSFGFGICVDGIREGSYQRADPNFVMLTPNKEHLAEGIQWEIGKRPVFQSDVSSGNFEGIPRELRPLEKIL
nr:Phosphoglucosamine mutase [Ipomoea batatas]